MFIILSLLIGEMTTRFATNVSRVAILDNVPITA